MVRKQRSLGLSPGHWKPTDCPRLSTGCKGASFGPGLGQVESTPQGGTHALDAKVPCSQRGELTTWGAQGTKQSKPRSDPRDVPVIPHCTSGFLSPPPSTQESWLSKGCGAPVGLVTRTQGNNPSWATRELTVIQPPACLLLALHLLWRPEAGREMLAVWWGAECRQGREEELRRQASSGASLQAPGVLPLLVPAFLLWKPGSFPP